MARLACPRRPYFGPMVAAASLAVTVLTPGSAHAQERDEEERNASVLDLPREGYESPSRQIGPFVVSTTANVRLEYDSNVFAQKINRIDDALVTFRPAIRAELDNGRVSSTTEARGSIYRYVGQTSENHEGYAISSRLSVGSERMTFGGRVAFERTFESRNDPEARRLFGTGPRLFDIGLAELTAGINGARTGAAARITAERYNFLSSLDDERDFISYQASLRARYRLSPAISVFAQGYVNWRDFRLAADRSGVNRDAMSKAALIGVEFDPGGKVRGEIAAGIVHLDPRQASFPGYTGAELRGSIIYRPRMRTAVTLNLFNGDVATVRLGATGRVDSRVRLGIQQEAYHNVLMSAGAGWRRTRYRGAGGRALTTWSADGEVEYLLNRHASVALTAHFVKRTVSNDPGAGLGSSDAFARFRGGLELRFKY